MIISLLWVALGFVLLMGGAEYAVRGAVAIANRLHIPTLIIGLTIVALGTSVPEFVVSMKAAVNGNAGISVGNVIGSNISNVLLVLGASALIYPIACNKKAFYRDFSFLFVVTLFFAFFVSQGKFVSWNGWVLLTLLVLFVVYNYFGAKGDGCGEEEIPSQLVNKGWLVIFAALIGGMTAITYGTEFLMKGAIDLARIWGVSEEMIGLTIVAVGTSMPELATSAMAAFRRQNGIALGNVVGSNIWNIVFVMGATSTITDVNVAPQFMRFDVWVMMGASFILLPMMLTKNRITRIEGFLMLLGFFAYIGAQILIAKGQLSVM